MVSLRDYAAVLFDLDGTLVDSTASIERLWRAWAERKGIDADYLMQHVHGLRTVETIALVAPALDAAAEAAALMREEIALLADVTRINGAAELLEELTEHGQRWGVVTSAPRDLALRKLELVDLPQPVWLISADDVVDGKPHPAPYLAAAAQLKCLPAHLVAIEDAPAGVASARAAGLTVIALRTTHADSALTDADYIVGDLRDLLS